MLINPLKQNAFIFIYLSFQRPNVDNLFKMFTIKTPKKIIHC